MSEGSKDAELEMVAAYHGLSKWSVLRMLLSREARFVAATCKGMVGAKAPDDNRCPRTSEAMRWVDGEGAEVSKTFAYPGTETRTITSAEDACTFETRLVSAKTFEDVPVVAQRVVNIQAGEKKGTTT